MSTTTDHHTDDHTGNRPDTKQGTRARWTRKSRVVALGAAAAAMAVPAAALPTTGTSEAYNVGVSSIHFESMPDSCHDGYGLPCTLGAGSGDSNVLRVTQSMDDGYLQFNDLEGTSLYDDHLWVGVEVGATCRPAYRIDFFKVDGNVDDPNLDGFGSMANTGGAGGASVGPQWPHTVSTPDAEVMPNKRIAVDVPIAEAFDSDLVFQFADVADVFDHGELEIQQRLAGGMSAEEARGTGFHVDTWLEIGARVQCSYNGLLPLSYFKRSNIVVPLRIEFEPADVAPPAKGNQVDGAITVPSQVTGSALSVLPDPADPCRLHLSGTITTNGAMDVEYRFLNPHGQPSNTYTVSVDGTGVAFVGRHVDIPLGVPSAAGEDYAPLPGGPIGGKAIEGIDGMYSGTYSLEIVSAEYLSDAIDGFNVPYCPGIEIVPQRTMDSADTWQAPSRGNDLGSAMGSGLTAN